jgi:hypothetical protein
LSASGGFIIHHSIFEIPERGSLSSVDMMSISMYIEMDINIGGRIDAKDSNNRGKEQIYETP